MVFLVLFGFFGLPPIIKAQAIKQLSSRLGRQVSIEKIRVNPLVLSTSVEGFSIAEADPAAGEFTGWRRLYVNFDSWSLVRGEIGFQEIALDGFRARVARIKGGAHNFDDILARVTADLAAVKKPEGKPSDPASSVRPTPLFIGVLAVCDAKVDFYDSSRERPFSTVVGPLSFGLQKFRTVGDPDSPYQFEAVTAAGERIAWRGTVSADPVKSQGELTLANIDLARLSPYYHQLVAGELRSAFVDFSGKYAFELKGAAPALSLTDGALTLRDVRFGAPGVEADAFALKRLAVTGISADSGALKAAIAKIAVQGVDLKLTRDAEGIDLLRLVAPRQPDSPSSPAASVSLPVVTLGELSVSGVRVTAIDLTTPRRAEHRVEDLVLSIRDLDSSKLDKRLPLSLEVKLPEGGRVAVNGSAAAQPLAAEIEVVLERVPFSNASPYIEPYLNVRMAGGVIRVNGKAALRDGAASFAGDFGIAGFRTVDGKLAGDFVNWTDLSMTGIKAATAPLVFHADEIRFVDPSANVRVEADGTLNIAQSAAAPAKVAPTGASLPAAATESAAAAAAPAAQATLPIAVTIGRVAFERAAFRFEDRSIKPAARGGIGDFTGAITGLSSEALGRADVALRGKVDGVAPFSITGKLNPLGRPAFVDLRVDFKGIDLQPVAGPYIGKFAGRELARGNLNVAVSAKLRDRKLDTSNVVTLDQFFLGAKTDSPDATKLPVGLALALLRDTHGKIVIDLPVKGSLDDPNFKIGRVVVRVLVNILTKAATSPFSLLGAAFGGGGDELGWQDFSAGSTSLDETGVKKLDTVAKALNARPALSLDIVGAYDPTADRDALQRAKLDQQIRALAWEARRQVDPNTPSPEQMEITPELRAGMLALLYTSAFPPAPGELAPAVVESSAAAQVVGFPVASVLGAERLERPRVAAGRPTKFNKRPAAVKPRQGSAAMAATQGRGRDLAPALPVEPTASSAVVIAASGESGSPMVPALTPEEMAARLAARIEIADAELHVLGEVRAQAIRAWLLENGKVSGERIFLGPVAAGGGRVNLNLR